MARRTPEFNYDQAAASYDRHRTGEGPYTRALCTQAEAVSAEHIVEVGAGTGNAARHVTAAYPCVLTCVEPSARMIAEGRGKNMPVRWVQAVGEQIPLATGSAQLVYAVMVLQHVAELRPFFAECGRVARGGRCAYVTVTHDFIREHPMAAYFPSFAEIDCNRFPDTDTVIQSMDLAGFHQFEVETAAKPPIPVDAAYADRVRNQFISTFALLPPGEFEAGMAHLDEAIAANGVAAPPFVWEAVVISGHAPVQ